MATRSVPAYTSLCVDHSKLRDRDTWRFPAAPGAPASTPSRLRVSAERPAREIAIPTGRTPRDPRATALSANRKVSFLSHRRAQLFMGRIGSRETPQLLLSLRFGWNCRPSDMGRRRNVGLWKRARRVMQKTSFYQVSFHPHSLDLLTSSTISPKAVNFYVPLVRSCNFDMGLGVVLGLPLLPVSLSDPGYPWLLKLAGVAQLSLEKVGLVEFRRSNSFVLEILLA
ncbi:hypothetical protein GW17_00021220 [Ensete ventricosum]|nr:hypothetical protein GW17_00021220 [Ensete ventricosum]